MKKLFLFMAFSVATMFAQAHNVTLTWNDTNPPGVTFNVYRYQGTCATPTFNGILAATANKTYVDTTVTRSTTYCYQVTAVFGAVESVPSNTASATVPPDSPTNLTTKGQ